MVDWPTATGSLCTVSDVKRISGITNEFTNDEISSQINDITDEILNEYNDPLKKIYTYTETNEYAYWVGERNIYRVDYIEINGSLVASGSYTGSLSQGYVTFTNTAVVDNNIGRRVEVHYTPKLYHLLCINMVVRDLLEVPDILAGEMARTPKLDKVNAKIERLKKKIIDSYAIILPSQYETYDSRMGTYVSQDFQNVF